MRISTLAVLAVVASEVRGFNPVFQLGGSSKATTSSALHMSSYLDSLNAYTAYQHQQTSTPPATEEAAVVTTTSIEATPTIDGADTTKGSGAGPAVDSNKEESIPYFSPPVAGGTVAPPSMDVTPPTAEVTPEVPVETKKTEEAAEKPIEIEAEIVEVKQTKAKAKPKTKVKGAKAAPKKKAGRPKQQKKKKEMKPILPPPPGSLVEPKAVAFKGGERSKDVMEEVETQKMITRIGFFVTVSLYVGIPFALFGLPSNVLLDKVEGKIGELINDGKPITGNLRDELISKGYVTGGEAKKPSNMILEGVQSAYSAATKSSGFMQKFQDYVDREVRLAQNPQPVDVDSVRDRLMMTKYYSGGYKNTGTSEVVSPKAVQPAVEEPVYPSTPLNLEQPAQPVPDETQLNAVPAAAADATAVTAAATTPETQPVFWQEQGQYMPEEGQTISWPERQQHYQQEGPQVQPVSSWDQYYQQYYQQQEETQAASVQQGSQVQPVSWDQQYQTGWMDQYYQQPQVDQTALSQQDQYYQENAQQASWHNEYYHQEQEGQVEWQGPYYEQYRDDSLF